MKEPLRNALPFGYLKSTQAILSKPTPLSDISDTAIGRRNTPHIKEALAWVAMENILGKLLEMPER